MKYLVTSYSIEEHNVPTIKVEIEGYPKIEGYEIIFYSGDLKAVNNEIVAIFEKTNVWIKKLGEK